MQNNNIIERLLSSFTDLEHAIEGAKNSLVGKESVPLSVLERLNSYDTVLEKQRLLATSLCEHINGQNWDEVSRHVNLINGLSALIRDDARSILLSLSNSSHNETEDFEMC